MSTYEGDVLGWFVWVYNLIVNDQLLSYFPRILVSIVLGALIGLERRQRHKSAGVRTYVVIAASAALITVCGDIMNGDRPTGDPTRLAGQILSGIGMIGAGVILRRGFSTTGITTAAMILLAVGVGIGSGFGFYSLTAVTTVAVLFAMSLSRRLLTPKELCQPVTLLCKVAYAEELCEHFGQSARHGGFDKTKGEDVVEFTIQPELTPQELDALLLRLASNPNVLRAVTKDAD